MKKLITLSLALILMLSACGGAQAKDINVSDAAEEILENVQFRDEMLNIDSDLAENYYKIDADAIEEYSIYISGSGGTTEEVAVFKLKNKDSLDTAKEMVQKRIENQKVRFENYVPEELDKLENPVIVNSDNILILVLADDAANAKKAAEDILK